VEIDVMVARETWTQQQIDLREAWEAGLAATAIGRQLGKSKGAVLGKAHRLRLPPPVVEEDEANRGPASAAGTARPCDGGRSCGDNRIECQIHLSAVSRAARDRHP
jgi:hypothetical protein